MKQYFTTIFVLTSLLASSQNSKWNVSLEPQKVFIENKSQFNDLVSFSGSEILFATEHGSSQFLFTKDGITCLLTKTEHVKPDDAERKKGKTQIEIEESEHSMKLTRDVVKMRWKNMDANVQVLGVSEVSAGFTYQTFKGGISAKAFKSIRYNNVYPLIDVEYIFNNEGRIEYNFILHSGADASLIQMAYSGMSRMQLDENKDLQFLTKFGNITEHGPVAFYAGSKKEIGAQFVKKGKNVFFALDAYDKSSEVIIDPWIATPSMGNSDKVFNIEADSSGNAYIYGGDSPYKLQKYDPAGALQWTFTNGWDSSTYWCGTLIVDRAGNSYITAGSTAEITKVNTTGNQVWTHGGGFVDEYWSMVFNCDESELVVGGTRLTGLPFPNGSGRAYNINLNDGSVINSIKVSNAIPSFFINDPNEIRSICGSPNGNYYFLTLDTIGSLSPAIATINWETQSGYRFGYGSPNYGFTPQGQSIIRATATHIYTANGDSIVMRDINTGAVVGAAAIPGGGSATTFLVPGTLPKNGGLVIDSCGNVFVGSQSNVTMYDANLNFISSTTTPSAVYDVAIGINGDVLACGNGFATALAISACGQIHLACNTVVLPVASFNAPNTICPGTCTDFTNLSTNATSFVWSFPGAQPAVSTDLNPTGICYNSPGTYDVTLVATGASGMDSVTITNYMTVYAYPPPQGIMQSGDTLFANQGSNSYQWYQDGILISGATEYNYVMSTGGNYNVVCTDSNGCEVEAVIFDVVAGISQYGMNNGSQIVIVFPNPATDKITVHVKQLSDFRIKLFNEIGEEISVDVLKTGSQYARELDINSLPNGVYVIAVEEGENVFRTTFVKQ
jgi:PKD repeat protein